MTPDVNIIDLGLAAILYFVVRDLLIIIRSQLDKKNNNHSKEFNDIVKSFSDFVHQWQQVAKDVDATRLHTERIARQTNELYLWHDRRDADGAFVWYNKASTADDIRTIKDAFSIQARLIDGVVEQVAEMRKQQKKE